MSYVAEPYAQFVDDLLRSLTGGVSRERFTFLPEEEPFRLAPPGPVIPGSIAVFGQAAGVCAVFRRDRDWSLGSDGSIVWRARADGSDAVQITHDPALRDWFPHLSPDGKWIVYVSFGDDVALEDHPPNREDVQLRIMPADGSALPQVLTRLFGGQGTINVPSWSPDGRQVAFVSYRLKR